MERQSKICRLHARERGAVIDAALSRILGVEAGAKADVVKEEAPPRTPRKTTWEQEFRYHVLSKRTHQPNGEYGAVYRVRRSRIVWEPSYIRVRRRGRRLAEEFAREEEVSQGETERDQRTDQEGDSGDSDSG